MSTCTGNALHCTGKVLVVLAMSHRGHSLVRYTLDIQASFPPVGALVGQLWGGYCTGVCLVLYPCR